MDALVISLVGTPVITLFMWLHITGRHARKYNNKKK